MEPIIGITAQISEEGDPFVKQEYLDYIAAAGGRTVIIPPVTDEKGAAEAIAAVDGVLIPGGDDIDARLYGEEPLPGNDEPVGARDISEPLIIKAVIASGTPFLGICRGCQMAQVALGGKLYQDIAAEVPKAQKHWQDPPYDRPAHHVVLVTDSPIGAEALSRNFWGPQGVNSLHRQAVKRPLAGDLEVMALGSDLLIEGVYIHDHPFFAAVQWHPELMPTNRVSKVISDCFLAAAAKHAEERVPKEEEEAPVEAQEDAVE